MTVFVPRLFPIQLGNLAFFTTEYTVGQVLKNCVRSFQGTKPKNKSIGLLFQSNRINKSLGYSWQLCVNDNIPLKDNWSIFHWIKTISVDGRDITTVTLWPRMIIIKKREHGLTSTHNSPVYIRDWYNSCFETMLKLTPHSSEYNE